MMKKFPSSFIFGTATSSYQIEGATDADGRTPSLWDYFCKQEGAVYEGHDGSKACEHYYRYKEDVKLMKEIGIQSYRMSISWPRIFPEKGVFSQKGMDFYSNLVEELIANNIEPIVTINHWDIPMWMFNEGGWENRDCLEYFVTYAETLFKHLGNRVKNWITHNEPFCIVTLGYIRAIQAPGYVDIPKAVKVSHHLLLSHGMVVKAFRKAGIEGGKIGITLNLCPAYSEEEEIKERVDGFINRWYLQPIFNGGYPEDVIRRYEQEGVVFDFIQKDDMEIINEKTDFFGLNYYGPSIVRSSKTRLLGYEDVPRTNPKTLEEWHEKPMYLYELLVRLKKEFTRELPIYITENGLGLTPNSLKNSIEDNGMICNSSENNEFQDEERIAYVHYHLEQVQKFIEEGGNLQRYYFWSLMDNFEWALGYSIRFGMVHVDFDTQERVMKDSAKWYKEVIKNRSL